MRLLLLFMAFSAEANIYQKYQSYMNRTESCLESYQRARANTIIEVITVNNRLRDCINSYKTSSTVSSRTELQIMEAKFKTFRASQCKEEHDAEWKYYAAQNDASTLMSETTWYVGVRIYKQYKNCLNKYWKKWDGMKKDWRKFSDKFKKKFLDK